MNFFNALGRKAKTQAERIAELEDALAKERAESHKLSVFLASSDGERERAEGRCAEHEEKARELQERIYEEEGKLLDMRDKRDRWESELLDTEEKLEKSEEEVKRLQAKIEEAERRGKDVPIGWLGLIAEELKRARSLHPGNAQLLGALMEEVGEVANALLEHGSGSDQVREECVQVATVAIRIAEEGDPAYPRVGAAAGEDA